MSCLVALVSVPEYCFISIFQGARMSDRPPLEKGEFNKVLDEVRDLNIGQKMMNHMLECEECKKLATELNLLSLKHIKDLEELQ